MDKNQNSSTLRVKEAYALAGAVYYSAMASANALGTRVDNNASGSLEIPFTDNVVQVQVTPDTFQVANDTLQVPKGAFTVLAVALGGMAVNAAIKSIRLGRRADAVEAEDKVSLAHY